MEKDLNLTIHSFGGSGRERTIVQLVGMKWLKIGLIYSIKERRLEMSSDLNDLEMAKKA